MRRPASRILLLLLATTGLVLGSCSDDGELGGPTVGGSLAAKVGAFELTHADLETEVENWAVNPNFLAEVLNIRDIGREGRRNAQLVAFVLEHRIVSEQSRQLAADSGYEPTDQELNGLLEQLDQAFPSTSGGPLFRVYDDEFRQKLATDFAYQQNLQTIDADTAEVAEVSVNPRYGSFEDRDRGIGGVVPPDGPLPVPEPQPSGS